MTPEPVELRIDHLRVRGRSSTDARIIEAALRAELERLFSSQDAAPIVHPAEARIGAPPSPAQVGRSAAAQVYESVPRSENPVERRTTS